MSYEAWIERGLVTRAVQIQARNIQDAYAKAKVLCEEGEVLRGVNKIESAP